MPWAEVRVTPREYEVRLAPGAGREFRRLRGAARDRIRAAIDDLAVEPRPSGAVKLAGRDDYRVRVGDYRVGYAVDDLRQAGPRRSHRPQARGLSSLRPEPRSWRGRALGEMEPTAVPLSPRPWPPSVTGSHAPGLDESMRPITRSQGARTLPASLADRGAGDAALAQLATRLGSQAATMLPAASALAACPVTVATNVSGSSAWRRRSVIARTVAVRARRGAGRSRRRSRRAPSFGQAPRRPRSRRVPPRSRRSGRRGRPPRTLPIRLDPHVDERLGESFELGCG